MRAGQLRHRITIQEPVETRDSYGSVKTTWSDLCTVWAGIWPIRAKEYVSAGQTQSEVTHTIRIRYRDDITSKMRIEFGTRYFSIVKPPINPDERKSKLDLVCTEEVA